MRVGKWLPTAEANQPAAKVEAEGPLAMVQAGRVEVVPAGMGKVGGGVARATGALAPAPAAFYAHRGPAGMAKVAGGMARATEALPPAPAALQAMRDRASGQEEVQEWARGQAVASMLLRNRILMVPRRSFP